MSRTASFANRLALLRHQKGMTQDEFAMEISEVANRNRAYSLLTVSAWESGDKLPPLHIFNLICDYFCVSADYMLGRSDDTGNKALASATPVNYKGIYKPDFLVTYNDLPKFDGEPIYVVFCDKRSHDRWGVLNAAKMEIAFPGAYLRVTRNTNCIYYARIPEFEKTPKYNLKKRLSMKQMKYAEKVWIEMISPNEKVKAQYNGWYRNNETKSLLINAIGLTLPYDGLSITYNAFSAEI